MLDDIFSSGVIWLMSSVFFF